MNNEWRNTRTEAELISGLGLYYQLVNLLTAKTREKIIGPLVTSVFDVGRANHILAVARRKLTNAVAHVDTHGMPDTDLLDTFVASRKLPVTPQKTGILRELTLEQYLLVEDVHYFLCERWDDHVWFYAKTAILEMAMMLLTRTTLQNGSASKRHSKLANELVPKWTDAFIERGFPFDFFVHDQTALASLKASQAVISIDRNILSTRCLSVKEHIKRDHYHHYYEV